MEALTRIQGVFKPKDMQTLKPEAKQYVGYIFTWEALWLIDDGVYAGQWIFRPLGKEGERLPLPFRWVLTEDIEEIKEGYANI